MIKRAIFTARGPAKEKQLKISLSAQHLIPDQVVGDKFRLQTALSSIFSTSIKYSPHGNKIDVTLTCMEPDDLDQHPSNRYEHVARRFTLMVKLEGEGIPATDLKELFTPFGRLEVCSCF
jgi:signal transduction histidine kinase